MYSVAPGVKKVCASLLRGIRRPYLDILEQISQGHFLLTAASALNKEVIPQGVSLSCDLPIDTLHTPTHTHTHRERERVDRWSSSCCEGRAENVWGHNKSLGHSQTERLHFSSQCYKAAENNQQPSGSCSKDPNKPQWGQEGVSSYIWWSDSLAFLKFPSTRPTAFSVSQLSRAIQKTHAALSVQFGTDDISRTWEKVEECCL